MKLLHFVDVVRIHVKAGDGGDGMVAFRREKYAPEGGPAGGHGGYGGSIYVEGNHALVTLMDLKMRPFIKARRGENGQRANKAGRGGEDVTVQVPLGTCVYDADTKALLGEVTLAGERLLVARGGIGGRGNESFATSRHRTPMRAEEGKPGEERNLILELKTIADVGIVGLPNAGKSTLLSSITNANPKIAPYPFTTLHPNLGVMIDESMSRVVTLADIPGLIEGAHAGAGLGDRFLRHIERTQLIVHLVGPEDGTTDPTEAAGRKQLAEELVYAYELVQAELSQYSEQVRGKPRIVCLNKTDLLSATTVRRILKEFAKSGVDALPISAREGKHLDQLKELIFARLEEAACRQPEPETPSGEASADAGDPSTAQSGNAQV